MPNILQNEEALRNYIADTRRQLTLVEFDLMDGDDSREYGNKLLLGSNKLLNLALAISKEAATIEIAISREIGGIKSLNKGE